MKEEQRKKLEKKQEFRNVEEQKKESFSGKEKFKRTTEVYLKDEVCLYNLDFPFYRMFLVPTSLLPMA